MAELEALFMLVNAVLYHYAHNFFKWAKPPNA